MSSHNLIDHFILSVFTFAITNIDDLVLLSVYFAFSNNKGAIIGGQYLGIVTLIAASLSGVILGSVFPSNYIRFLGLVPIAIGLKDLWTQFRKKEGQEDESPDTDNLSLLKVSGVTIANGGDNIGVYTPLFASLEIEVVPVYVLNFLLLTAVWCFLGYTLTRHRGVRTTLHRYKRFLLPAFLIGLGIWIIAGM
jgi:cadmium resistance protein CadD (predicted permease)